MTKSEQKGEWKVMTREETVQILSILRRAYPVFYKDISKREAENTVDLWHTMFEDDDVLLVINAVKVNDNDLLINVNKNNSPIMVIGE